MASSAARGRNARTEEHIIDNQTTREHAIMFANRLRKRHKHLSKWARKQGTNAFRVYDADIPEIPLEVDWYGGHLHIAARSNRGALKHTETPEVWLDIMVEAAADALQVPTEKVFLKRRQRQKGSRQYTARPDSFRVVVEEEPARFEVDLAGYLDTGLFLDHRITRRLVGEAADGARMLNLFGYTGAFSVHAALGGAKQTVTVDLSPTYLRWAKANFRLNDASAELIEVHQLSAGLPGGHVLAQGDVPAFLHHAETHGWRFDLIVIDPPTFSNSARTDTVFDVQRDHAELIQRSLLLLDSGGALYFSTNRRKFRLDDDAATHPSRSVSVEDLTARTISEDFRGRPHRCWRATFA